MIEIKLIKVHLVSSTDTVERLSDILRKKIIITHRIVQSGPSRAYARGDQLFNVVPYERMGQRWLEPVS
jgi:hypothetical protein